MKSLIGIELIALTSGLAFSLATSASAAENPGPVRGIVFAQPFKLDKPYTHTWRKEQPQVSAGYVLVLTVDPDFVRPVQVAEPVLYVGNQTAERINAGDVSGRLVVLVPSTLNARGEVALDLNSALIWFGAPELPERVDADRVNSEARAASNNGIKPLARDQVQAALRRGGKTVRLPDREAMGKILAALLQEYSPNETDLIRGLKVTSK
jgi:hypothetical protein